MKRSEIIPVLLYMAGFIVFYGGMAIIVMTDTGGIVAKFLFHYLVLPLGFIALFVGSMMDGGPSA